MVNKFNKQDVAVDIVKDLTIDGINCIDLLPIIH